MIITETITITTMVIIIITTITIIISIVDEKAQTVIPDIVEVTQSMEGPQRAQERSLRQMIVQENVIEKEGDQPVAVGAALLHFKSNLTKYFF